MILNVKANGDLHRISFGEDTRLKALLDYVQEKAKTEHKPLWCGSRVVEAALPPGDSMNE